MNSKIVVVTDFSASSANALQYACALATDKHYDLVLCHIYDIPTSYSGEGLSLTTVEDALKAQTDRLREALEHTKAKHTELNVEARTVIGGFTASLNMLEKEVKPNVLILGAQGHYADLWLWDNDWLDALVNVSLPVLVIPSTASYTPVRNIAYACDCKTPCTEKQIAAIRQFLQLPESRLHIINVDKANTAEEQERKMEVLNGSLDELSPHYHFISERQIIRAVSDFVAANDIQLLLVTPRKHGLWYNLLNKSYTKQLARFNSIPVMAIHE